MCNYQDYIWCDYIRLIQNLSTASPGPCETQRLRGCCLQAQESFPKPSHGSQQVFICGSTLPFIAPVVAPWTQMNEGFRKDPQAMIKLSLSIESSPKQFLWPLSVLSGFLSETCVLKRPLFSQSHPALCVSAVARQEGNRRSFCSLLIFI